MVLQGSIQDIYKKLPFVQLPYRLSNIILVYSRLKPNFNEKKIIIHFSQYTFFLYIFLKTNFLTILFFIYQI